MATLIIMAVITTTAINWSTVETAMDKDDFWSPTDSSRRHEEAEQLLVRAFTDAGWRVSRQPVGREDYRPDLLVRKSGAAYAIEVKVGVEGRTDRLIPLWSQACLQAARTAGKHAPLAVVAAPQITRRVANNILDFAEKFAPDTAAGVVDFEGLRMFRGPHLELLNAEASPKPTSESRSHARQTQLFSDLNQWMLKVLLAPELPNTLLSAPRAQYRNVSQLARGARVSVMTAFRFVQQLRREGYLHESDAYLTLVRRDDLFRRWATSGYRSVNEAPMRLLLGGGDSRAWKKALQPMLDSGQACLALFAAADALGFGQVEGVPPHVYIRRLDVSSLSAASNLVPVAPGERPDVIVRQAPAHESVFRGVVRPSGLPSCDILQVWLDVSDHPSRGQEQADLIRKRVVDRVVKGASHRE
jgi:hypothetical protein